MAKIDVTWIMNDFGRHDGQRPLHAHRVHEQARHPGRQSRVVLMDADVVTIRRSFHRPRARARKKSKSLVCGKYRETDEEVMVRARGRRPRRPRRGLGTPTVKGMKCLWRGDGPPSSSPKITTTGSGRRRGACSSRPRRRGSEHEDITQRLMLARALDRRQLRRRRALQWSATP